MARTKRYVPHWVIENELHPWTDPVTGEPYKWARNEHQQLRTQQRHNARLRGDDGRCPNSNRWDNRWVNPMDAVRTNYRRLINEGIEDHFGALEDHGKEFDWRGNQTNDGWYDDEPMDLPDWWYYQESLEDQAREEEYERREQELNDIYFVTYDYDYDYGMY